MSGHEAMYQSAVRGAPRRGGGYQRPAGSREQLRAVLVGLHARVRAHPHLPVALPPGVVEPGGGRGAPGRGHGAERWTNPFNRLYNVALCVFAMLHGLNGLRYSIEDYVRKPGRQVAVKAVAYTLLLSVMAWGVFALLTFDSDDRRRR